jgi:hypothetical protein
MRHGTRLNVALSAATVALSAGTEAATVATGAAHTVVVDDSGNVLPLGARLGLRPHRRGAAHPAQPRLRLLQPPPRRQVAPHRGPHPRGTPGAPQDRLLRPPRRARQLRALASAPPRRPCPAGGVRAVSAMRRTRRWRVSTSWPRHARAGSRSPRLTTTTTAARSKRRTPKATAGKEEKRASAERKGLRRSSGGALPGPHGHHVLDALVGLGGAPPHDGTARRVRCVTNLPMAGRFILT